MATLNRPPFWVPRPPDDNIWQWAPPRGALTLTIQEKKFFGAPGQVPTKRWWPHYTLNEPPEWQGPIIEWMNSGAILLTNTQVKFFGQHGQAPTKNWAPQYTYDDPGPWWFKIEWMNSAVIQQLSHQKIFGQGGQVPPSRWNFNYDETPPWQMPSDWMNSGVIQNLSQPTMFGAGGQAPTKNWSFPFSYDETPMWQGAPFGSNIIRLLSQPKMFGAGGQVPTARWNFNYDETPPWQFDINWMTSGVIQNLSHQVMFGQGGQVVQFRPNFTYDDPPPWQFAFPRNPNVLPVPSATQSPFVPRFWNFNYDETAPWYAAPIGSNINFFPTLVPRAPFWALRPGFDTEWTGSPIAMSALNIPQANPFVPRFWNFNYDETPPWQADINQLNSAIIKILSAAGKPPVPRFWRFDYDETPPWQANVEQLNSAIIQILSAAGKPLTVRFRYEVDDSAVWQGAPIAMSALHIPQQVSTRPFANPYQHRLSYDETPPWSFWQPYATNVTFSLSSFGLYSPRSNWQQFIINYDETPPWDFWRPYATNATITSASFKLYPPRNDWQPWTIVDDAAVWQWIPHRNLAATTVALNPFVPVFWRYDYDETAPWYAAPVGSNLNFLPQVTYVPRAPFWAIRPAEEQVWQGSPIAVSSLNLPTLPPVNVLNIYRWWFNYDDAPVWQGAPIGSNQHFLTAPPKPFSNPPWRFNYDETPPWDFWGPYANNATFTASSFIEYAPRSNWQSQILSVDDQPIWVGTPLNASTLYLPIPPPPTPPLPSGGGGHRKKTKAQIARESANAALVEKAKLALSPGDKARAQIAMARTRKATFGPVQISMAELKAVLDALDEDDEED